MVSLTPNGSSTGLPPPGSATTLSFTTVTRTSTWRTCAKAGREIINRLKVRMNMEETATGLYKRVWAQVKRAALND